MWKQERRLGLEIDQKSHTAKESRLYSTRHVRMLRDVSLGMLVDGLPENGWKLPESGYLGPLGGENRVAEYSRWDACKLEVETPLSQISSTKEVAIISLAPLDLDPDIIRGRATIKLRSSVHADDDSMPVDNGDDLHVVSACVTRPIRIGGWDSLKRQPLPLRSLLPAGSVLFCKIDDAENLMSIAKSSGGLLQVGERTRWGLG